MKRDRLYIVNSHNKGRLIPANLFYDGGPAGADPFEASALSVNGAAQDWFLNPKADTLGSITVIKTPQVNGQTVAKIGQAGAKALAKGSLGRVIGNGLKSGAGAIGNVVGGVGNTLLSHGLNTKAGSAISSVGGTVGNLVSHINPVAGGIVSAASGLIGGAVNGAFGYKLKGDTEAKSYLADTASTNFGGNNDTVEEQLKNLQTTRTVTAKNGWFTNKGTKKANKLNNRVLRRENLLAQAADNAIQNNQETQQRNMDAAYYAFGGPIGGAVDYGFMQDYLTMKADQAKGSNKTSSMPNSFGTFSPTGTLFADGGGLRGVDQTHGATFDNGANYVGAGGYHETNPNDGVQVGTDGEGTPNLVEEGEVIWNDFVFSNRIEVPQELKKSFGIRGKKPMSFADMAQKLQDEAKERPNDPISKAGLDASLERLANTQEELKKQAEAERAKAEFDALPPEQQKMIMDKLREGQEQELRQRQIQEQQMQEQQMQQQQMPQEQQPSIDEEGVPLAYGGDINDIDDTEGGNVIVPDEEVPLAYGGKLYPDGGYLRQLIKGLGLNTYDELAKFAADNGIKDKLFSIDGDGNYVGNDNVVFSDAVLNAIAKKNPQLAHSMRAGNRFSAYTPTQQDMSFDYANGTWTHPTVESWKNSQDPMWQEAIRKNLIKDNMTREELEQALMSTDAWKKGTEWLKDEKNSAIYLDAILNSPDTPQQAKDYAARFRKDGQWTTDAHSFDDVYNSGQKVRFTYPGTYWKNIPMMRRGKTVKNFLTMPDGTMQEIADLDGLERVTGYDWGDDKGDYTYTYYRRKGDANPASPAQGNTDNGEKGGKGNEYPDIEPVHKPEWMRYAGVFGPAIGLGLWGAGVGKPDTSELDAAVNMTQGAPMIADYKPIGNYLTYTPLDRDRYVNKLNAQAGATRRAIMNSGTTPSRAAAILASDNSYLGKVGDALIQGEDYNWNRRKDTETFNRETDRFNAEAFNRTASDYANAYNSRRQLSANMALQAAREKMDARSQWYNGLYGNIGQLMSGLSAIGKENAQHNVLADLAAQDAYGRMDPDQPFAGRWVQYPTGTKSTGGRIGKHRRGGLTY